MCSIPNIYGSDNEMNHMTLDFEWMNELTYGSENEMNHMTLDFEWMNELFNIHVDNNSIRTFRIFCRNRLSSVSCLSICLLIIKY